MSVTCRIREKRCLRPRRRYINIWKKQIPNPRFSFLVSPSAFIMAQAGLLQLFLSAVTLALLISLSSLTGSVSVPTSTQVPCHLIFHRGIKVSNVVDCFLMQIFFAVYHRGSVPPRSLHSEMRKRLPLHERPHKK